MNSYAVVVNDCAAPGVPGIMAVRTQNTQFGDQNFILKIEDLAHGLPAVLTERQLDWIEVLGYLFAADLMCRRGPGDIEWSREIEAWFPVRDPGYWSGQAVAIQEVFGALTADRLTVHFEGADMHAAPPRQGQTPFPDHDAVALVSGGVDSFVGAMEHVGAGGRPLLLSHLASGATTTAQVAVEDAIREAQADISRLKLSAAKHDSSIDPEPSQRSRTFLFVGAAALVAAVGGSNRVLINENGVMAMHLPLTEARIGTLSTRTASPPIMARLESLASDVLDADLTVENRLVEKSKPEVVADAVSAGYEGNLVDTVSCWSIGRTRKHCGVCPPCLMRRISFATHDVDDVDYKVDAFNDESVLDDPHAQDHLAHFVGQVEDLLHRADHELQFEYPELLNAAPALTAAQALELHRRWAREADAILSTSPVVARVR